MKKIMFNDQFGLTQAVLDGRKTMTRRVFYIPEKLASKYYIESDKLVVCESQCNGELIQWRDSNDNVRMIFYPIYRIGEIIAIAQSYKALGYAPDSLDRDPKDLGIRGFMRDSAGWNNKMFVLANACKNKIKITNIKVQRLKDISVEDCLSEGIIKGECGSAETHFMDAYYIPNDKQPYCTPQEAFKILIDKIVGKGTWKRNPYVWAYEFELVK